MKELIILAIYTFCTTNGFKGPLKSFGEEDQVIQPFTIVSQTKEVTVTKGDFVQIIYNFSGNPTICGQFKLISTKNIVDLPPAVEICPEDYPDWKTNTVNFTATRQGITTIEVEVTPPEAANTDDAFMLLSIELNPAIDKVSDVIGWVYTIAWDISFLPQIVHNWRRKSVIGLSFDFLVFNFIGFSCYFLFNSGLFWILGVQEQYYLRHPQSVLHVRLNDVIFPLYAVICTFIQLVQCTIYERGNQRVSLPCIIISCLMGISIVIYGILVPFVDRILWLDFLYMLSYIKLTITCIKYTPQLYENFKYKSTEGWNIWQVILDCTGGTFSLLQMFLLAYNYDDFQSILTDPTKLGLGLLSIFFNIFFFMQHYCLYRNNTITSEFQDKNSKSTTELSMS